MVTDERENNPDTEIIQRSAHDRRHIQPIMPVDPPTPSWKGLDLSPQFDALFDALSQAQSQIDSAPKSGLNQYLGNKYSTLDDVRRACAKPLSEAKIGWTQVPINTGQRLGVVTLLVHKDQWMRSTLTVEVPEVLMSTNRKGQQIKTNPRSDPQQIARLITYLRRIALASMVGVTSTEEDTDGDVVPDQAGATEPLITPEQLHELQALMERAQVKQDQIKAAYNIEALPKLRANLFESCKARLVSTIEAKDKAEPHVDA